MKHFTTKFNPSDRHPSLSTFGTGTSRAVFRAGIRAHPPYPFKTELVYTSHSRSCFLDWSGEPDETAEIENYDIMSLSPSNRVAYLEKVSNELARYEHPLFEWAAEESERGVLVIVTLKDRTIYDAPYRFYLTQRELDAQSFKWDFQRQLYNYLHDYLVEMFTRSPQIRDF